MPSIYYYPFYLRLLPKSQKTKGLLKEYLEDSEDLKERVSYNRASWTNPTLYTLADKIRQKKAYETEPPAESGFFKFLELLKEQPTGANDEPIN